MTRPGPDGLFALPLLSVFGDNLLWQQRSKRSMGLMLWLVKLHPWESHAQTEDSKETDHQGHFKVTGRLSLVSNIVFSLWGLYHAKIKTFSIHDHHWMIQWTISKTATIYLNYFPYWYDFLSQLFNLFISLWNVKKWKTSITFLKYTEPSWPKARHIPFTGDL